MHTVLYIEILKGLIINFQTIMYDVIISHLAIQKFWCKCGEHFDSNFHLIG
jgi:hypothetical protein